MIRKGLVLALVIIGVAAFGTPHMLVEYKCIEINRACHSYTSCDYVGVHGWQHYAPGGANCPMVKMMPLDAGKLQQDLGRVWQAIW